MEQDPGKPWPDPVSIFFDYGRYEVVDDTDQGLGQDQLTKLSQFVTKAVSAKVNKIIVNGYASPENNLPPYQLPLNRAKAIKNWLDQRFANTAIKPTIEVKTTSVLSGDQSTWPSLRRADVYVVA